MSATSHPTKPCQHCGRDLHEVYGNRYMVRRSKYCPQCYRAAVHASRVIVDDSGTWIETSSGRRSRISPCDAEFAATESWHVDSVGYLAGGKRQRFHRLILAPIPKGLQVDHINHDQLDNRRENLRIVTHAANQRNFRSRCESTGVIYSKSERAWIARISDRGRNVYLGIFRDRETAILARRAGEDALWGDEQ